MSKNNAIKLLPIYDATLSERAEASQLIIDALPEFYEIFGNKKNVLLAIADLLGDPNSDISSGVMALGGNCVAGICTWVSNENRSIAQMYHVKHLCNQRPNGFKELSPKLKSYSERVEPIHSLKSIYLSRIAVSRDYVGTGLAIRLIDEFMKHVDTGEVANLHVKDDNGRAINFYNKVGFCFSPYSSTPSRQLQSQKYNYRLMTTK